MIGGPARDLTQNRHMIEPQPYLLIDVDGVVSLFGFDSTSPPPGRMALVDGLPHLLSEIVATRLRRLAPLYACAWCTGWEERATDHLPDLLGLPRTWPFVPLTTDASAAAPAAGHWKLDPIDAFAGRERPLAWVDDRLDEACGAWAAARPGPTLLVRTDPAVGLTEADTLALESWARAPREP